MSVKILATGDIHIGQRVSGIPDNTGRLSGRDAWNRIVDWSVENSIDVLALTGDIIDQNNNFFEAIGPLQSGFSRLRDNKIKVIMVAGNHDYNVLPQIIAKGGYDNVSLLGKQGKWELLSVNFQDGPVQFAGWSFPSRYVKEDPLLKFDLETDRSVPCIGLLHGEITSAGSDYGPLNFNRLSSLPVNCWVLGHIHKPQQLSHQPYICYAGSPLAFSSKEPGHHGPLLITIDNGRIIAPQRVLFSPVRFDNLSINISGVLDEDDFRDRIMSELNKAGEDFKEELEGVRYLIFDVVLTGSHDNIRDLEKWSMNITSDVELTAGGLTKKVNRTTLNVIPEAGNLEELAKMTSPAGLLAGTILAIKNGEKTTFLDKLSRDFRNQYRNICNSEVFLPLGIMEESEEQIDIKARQYILKESTRLLSELLQQKQ